MNQLQLILKIEKCILQVKDKVSTEGTGYLRCRRAGSLCPAWAGGKEEKSWDVMKFGDWSEAEVTVTCDTHSRVASKYRSWDHWLSSLV